MIVEDEEIARAALRRLIEETDWLELVGEASDGPAAIEAVDRLRPDLLFLDVVLPDLNGLAVAERIQHRPLIVFTTAYERYAVTAFELEALDYLVKPFGPRRFRETLDRIHRRLEHEEAPSSIEQVRAAFSTGPLERLFARNGSRVIPVRIGDVDHFQAEGDYVRAFLGERGHLLRIALSELEQRLDLPFLRIHRSHMINVDRIEKIEREDERRFVVFLRNGTRIVASRAGTMRLRELIR
jgi:two-component system LytT family response regulator